MRGLIAFLLVAACASSGDEGKQQPAPDAAIDRCGDGICAASEIGACSADCGSQPMAVCGNGTCESGETAAACPADCSAGACGDGTCNGAETMATCPGDCSGSAVCGDGTCNGAETMATCPGDCSATSAMCGNAVCDAGESSLTCPSDCTASTCPGGDDVGCFFCWFDPTQCIPPQTEALCGACLGL